MAITQFGFGSAPAMFSPPNSHDPVTKAAVTYPVIQVTDQLDLRVREVARLVNAYLKFAKTVFALLPLDHPSLAFPMLMIERPTWKPDMPTTQRYRHTFTIALIAVLTGTDREKLAQDASLTAAALLKIFSNNAEGDVTTSAGSARWKANDTILEDGVTAWWDCDISFALPIHGGYELQQGQTLLRVVDAKLVIQSETLIP
jgi:hypothetical protein